MGATGEPELGLSAPPTAISVETAHFRVVAIVVPFGLMATWPPGWIIWLESLARDTASTKDTRQDGTVSTVSVSST
jgi:hypothetical protein